VSQTLQETAFARLRNTLVTPAQDCHPPAAALQGARELLDNRRFARATDRQIANADHETTQRAFSKNSLPVRIQTQLHDPFVDEG
jgi:hypothetical protein